MSTYLIIKLRKDSCKYIGARVGWNLSNLTELLNNFNFFKTGITKPKYSYNSSFESYLKPNAHLKYTNRNRHRTSQ